MRTRALADPRLCPACRSFIGLHTYPYAPNPAATGHNEPTVWVGVAEDLEADGRIKPAGAYPTSYANTMRGEWGYAPLPTSNYSWGSAELFETDCYAPPPMDQSSCPWPASPQSQGALFERTSTMLQTAFALGDTLGVQSCVGTETPLATPLRPAPKCRITAEYGCYQDNRDHILPHVVATDASQNTHEWCAGQCALVGLGISGVEFGVNCFCGSSLPNASHVANMSLCATHVCPADASELCGGCVQLPSTPPPLVTWLLPLARPLRCWHMHMYMLHVVHVPVTCAQVCSPPGVYI